MMEKFARALNRVWDVIGADCLVNEEGEPDESVTMEREDVFEICCDHVYLYGGLSEEDLTAFQNRDRKLDDMLMGFAFPYEFYGW